MTARQAQPTDITQLLLKTGSQIAKSATQIFEQFNHVRNKQSLAHDNQILTMAEGKYVFETVLSLLRFIKSLDETKFGH